MVKNPPANAGDLGSIPGWEDPLEKENGNPLQYSCLGNRINRGAWEATVHGFTRVGHDLVTRWQRFQILVFRMPDTVLGASHMLTDLCFLTAI